MLWWEPYRAHYCLGSSELLHEAIDVERVIPQFSRNLLFFWQVRHVLHILWQHFSGLGIKTIKRWFNPAATVQCLVWTGVWLCVWGPTMCSWRHCEVGFQIRSMCLWAARCWIKIQRLLGPETDLGIKMILASLHKINCTFSMTCYFWTVSGPRLQKRNTKIIIIFFLNFVKKG